MGEQLGDGERLSLRDRLLAGAFQDEVPGVGVREGAGAVEAGAEAVEQRPVAQGDVGQVPRGGADRRQARPVASVSAL